MRYLVNHGESWGLLGYEALEAVGERLLALILVVAIAPVITLIAIAIRVDSAGSPIFAQERVGKNGSRFTLYKFRTMHLENDDSNYKEYVKRLVIGGLPYRVDHRGKALYKIIDDSRVTRFGALLRKTNLDELPQVFNVLNGDMSFVGPRPDIPFAVEMYSDWHRERLRVRPGITGLWQVSERNSLSFDEMVKLDIEYINNKSLFYDFKILLRTVGVILAMDGSYRREKEAKHG